MKKMAKEEGVMVDGVNSTTSLQQSDRYELQGHTLQYMNSLVACVESDLCFSKESADVAAMTWMSSTTVVPLKICKND